MQNLNFFITFLSDNINITHSDKESFEMSQFSEEQVTGFLEAAGVTFEDDISQNLKVGYVQDVLNGQYTSCGDTIDCLQTVARLNPDQAHAILNLSQGKEPEGPGIMASVGSAISSLFNGASDPVAAANPGFIHEAQEQYEASTAARIESGMQRSM
jgi:hypothetical protein